MELASARNQSLQAGSVTKICPEHLRGRCKKDDHLSSLPPNPPVYIDRFNRQRTIDTFVKGNKFPAEPTPLIVPLPRKPDPLKSTLQILEKQVDSLSNSRGGKSAEICHRFTRGACPHGRRCDRIHPGFKTRASYLRLSEEVSPDCRDPPPPYTADDPRKGGNHAVEDGNSAPRQASQQSKNAQPHQSVESSPAVSHQIQNRNTDKTQFCLDFLVNKCSKGQKCDRIHPAEGPVASSHAPHPSETSLGLKTMRVESGSTSPLLNRRDLTLAPKSQNAGRGPLRLGVALPRQIEVIPSSLATIPAEGKPIQSRPMESHKISPPPTIDVEDKLVQALGPQQKGSVQAQSTPASRATRPPPEKWEHMESLTWSIFETGEDVTVKLPRQQRWTRHGRNRRRRTAIISRDSPLSDSPTRILGDESSCPSFRPNQE
ncbi:hypothetical protein JAAARDRAFT_601597 [Jaapia argillacea MUCL 33604]|uniref:C3H1-type domain-containing protein n=1 Tax=Jaapia argillacea MUCL 33604 TaxID=933084 RepID=A0A067QCG3_9AGAM|nr:hypothetical protein JAAARDRAFT_601597 [Jaapia argillacea MUCL 33604]